jgi:cold shock CspA family protein
MPGFFAEYLFWTGRTDEAQKLVDDLDRIAPATYRTRSPRVDDEITDKMNEFSGTVFNRKERFFFIKSGTFPKPAFAFFDTLQNAEYEDLENGQKVSMKLRFNRQGPCAVEVKLI